MDGFALRAADTPGRLPVVARIAAGRPAPSALAPGEAMGIATGGVVPEGADAVVPIEVLSSDDDERSRFAGASSAARTCGRAAATCARATSSSAPARSLAPGRARRSRRGGVAEVACARRPRAAVVTTGTRAPPSGRGARAGPDLRVERRHARRGARVGRRGRRAARIGRGRRGRAPRGARARARRRRARHVRRRLGRPARPRAADRARSSASRRSSGASP